MTADEITARVHDDHSGRSRSRTEFSGRTTPCRTHNSASPPATPPYRSRLLPGPPRPARHPPESCPQPQQGEVNIGTDSRRVGIIHPTGATNRRAHAYRTTISPASKYETLESHSTTPRPIEA